MKLALLLFLVLVVEVSGRRITPEEDLEIQRILQLNKPALKTIYTEYGDIYDCVDINKQPSLDHPQLRNHVIQMRPSSFPKGTYTRFAASSTNTSLQIGLVEGCFTGTVPIRRILKGDILRSKSLSRFGKRPDKTSDSINSSPGINREKIYLAGLNIHLGKYYGAKAFLNTWQPTLSYPDQFSLSEVLLVNGYSVDKANFIEAGWAVHQELFNDTRVRLFTHWTVDNYGETGCFNVLCQGFVQLNTDIPLGIPIPWISQYGGDQFELGVHIFRDPKSHHWYLVIPQPPPTGDAVVGYWPNTILTSLSTDGAKGVYWGGEVLVPDSTLKGPQMGSGHFPWERFGKAAYIRAIQYGLTEGDPDALVEPDNYFIEPSKPDCYDAVEYRDGGLLSILYGGEFQHPVCHVPTSTRYASLNGNAQRINP